MQSKFKYILILIIVIFLVMIVTNLRYVWNQHYSFLAESFLHGKTYFLKPPNGWIDSTPHNNHHYWPLGVLPALILMPFVYLFDNLNLFFYQGYLNIFLVAAIFITIYKIAIKLKFNKNDSLYLALGFSSATQFISIAFVPSSWYFTQSVDVLLLFLLIHEYVTKKRYWFLSFISGLLLLTRPLSSLAIIFVGSSYVFEKIKLKKRIISKDILQIVFPFAVCVAFYMFYNFIRFNNPFEQGYSFPILLNDSFKTAKSYGIFSLIHIPGNLYYFFLSMPQPIFRDSISHVLKYPFLKPDPWGTSIFITSPILLFLFPLKARNYKVYLALATSLLIAVILFSYYAIGYSQYGYRYALDFLPLVYYCLLLNLKARFKSLSKLFKFAVIFSTFLNLFLLGQLLP